MPRRDRSEIILKSLQINGCVRRHLGAVASGKSGWPCVLYTVGSVTGAIVLLNGTGTSGSAVISG